MEAFGGVENSAMDYLRVLWRRRWLVAAAALVAVAVSSYVSSKTERVYEGTSRLALSASDSSIFNSAGNPVNDPLQVATAVQFIESRKIGDAVAARLGPDSAQLRGVSAVAVEGTRIINITVKAASPRVAAKAATTYAETFRDVRRDQAVENALDLGKRLASRTAQARAELDEYDARLAAAVAQKQPATDQQVLRQQRDAALASYLSLQQRAEQANIDASVRTGGADVLEPGHGSTTPISPKPRQSAALALAVGLMLGIVAAIGLDFLDDSLRSVEEIGRRAHDVPILATIPTLIDWRDENSPWLATVESPHSPAAESYRSLRTSVQLLEASQHSPVIEVTSPAAGEGKTTTVANLAVAFAMAGRRVTIVDCDLRRPRVHEFFSMTNDRGLTSVLAGDLPLNRALQEVILPDGRKLHVLSSGFRAANPAELVGTSRLTSVLTTLKNENDIVLVDAPPVLPVTDAVVLAEKADCVLLVASVGKTTRRHFARALGALSGAGAPLAGIVVNRGPADNAYYYTYRSDTERPARGSRLRWLGRESA